MTTLTTTKHVFFGLAVALAVTGCASVPENAKPYTCFEYNKARAALSSPTRTVTDADLLRFYKVNMVTYKTELPKHITRDELPDFISNVVNYQAAACRVDPDATIHYTAVQETPTSVRLGSMMTYPSGQSSEAREAYANLRMKRPVVNEAGMQPVKAHIQNCVAGKLPATECKLGNL